MGQMMTENYCDDCDNIVHAVFDEDEFYSFKTGRIRCACGCVTRPCNECIDEDGQHYNCSECPWANSEIGDAMTDGEYVQWVHDNNPDIFKCFLSGEFSDYFKSIAERVANSSQDCE